MTPNHITYIVGLYLSFLWPVFAGNSTNDTGGNNTLYSQLKNKTVTHFDSCEWSDVRPSYSIAKSIVGGFLIIDGCILFVLGYKQARTSFSLIGFSVAALVGYAIVDYKFDLSLGIEILVVGSSGLFGSILSSSVTYCGMFLTGLGTGFSLGCLVILIVSEITSFGSFAEPVLIILLMSIIFASLCLWWKRTFIILGTSMIGGAFIAGGLDYFIEDLLFVQHIQHIIYGMEYRKLCFFSWIVLSIFPVISIAGVFIQHFKTAKGHKPKTLNHEALAMNRLSHVSQQPTVSPHSSVL